MIDPVSRLSADGNLLRNFPVDTSPLIVELSAVAEDFQRRH